MNIEEYDEEAGISVNELKSLHLATRTCYPIGKGDADRKRGP